jgi:hypothetical protein
LFSTGPIFAARRSPPTPTRPSRPRRVDRLRQTSDRLHVAAAFGGTEGADRSADAPPARTHPPRHARARAHRHARADGRTSPLRTARSTDAYASRDISGSSGPRIRSSRPLAFGGTRSSAYRWVATRWRSREPDASGCDGRRARPVDDLRCDGAQTFGFCTPRAAIGICAGRAKVSVRNRSRLRAHLYQRATASDTLKRSCT